MDDDVIRDHLEQPFHLGKLRGASAIWSKRNPACGDEVSLSLRISGHEIVDAWHEVRGCMLCRAAASILCEHLSGQTLMQADMLSEAEMLTLTGIEISPGRRGCCVLPLWTLKELLHNYRIVAPVQ